MTENEQSQRRLVTAATVEIPPGEIRVARAGVVTQDLVTDKLIISPSRTSGIIVESIRAESPGTETVDLVDQVLTGKCFRGPPYGMPLDPVLIRMGGAICVAVRNTTDAAVNLQVAVQGFKHPVDWTKQPLREWQLHGIVANLLPDERRRCQIKTKRKLQPNQLRVADADFYRKQYAAEGPMYEGCMGCFVSEWSIDGVPQFPLHVPPPSGTPRAGIPIEYFADQPGTELKYDLDPMEIGSVFEVEFFNATKEVVKEIIFTLDAVIPQQGVPS